MTKTTALALLNGGAGVPTGSNVPELHITTRGGHAYDVDLDPAQTIQDVLTAIGTATGGVVTATFNAQQEIVLADGSTGSGVFAVSRPNGASAATAARADDGRANGTITGTPLAIGFGVSSPGCARLRGAGADDAGERQDARRYGAGAGVLGGEHLRRAERRVFAGDTGSGRRGGVRDHRHGAEARALTDEVPDASGDGQADVLGQRRPVGENINATARLGLVGATIAGGTATGQVVWGSR